MIEIKTVRNNIASKEGSYCFSSVPNSVAGSKEIIKRMIEYNSTLTEADANAALTIIENVINDLLTDGVKVKLPWLSLYYSAHGTAQTSSSNFVPGKGDNNFKLKASLNKKLERELAEEVAYTSKADGIVLKPKIIDIFKLNSDAKTVSELAFRHNEILRLHGRNLLFDFFDEKQGVFFHQENSVEKIRAKNFTHHTDRIIDLIVPENLKNGEYKLSVVTKQKTNGYLTVFCSQIVSVVD